MADTLTEEQTTVDPYADHDAIRNLVQKKREEWGRGRENFIRAAYRNILFYRGQQWIRWDRAINRFRPARLPKGTPTPVTNRFGSTVDALVSVFARVEPRLTFAPGSPQEPEDRAAADTATRAIAVVEDEVSIRTQRQMLATWVGLTGGAWLETGYDPDPAHGTRPMDVEQCTQCGHTQAPLIAMACEACGGTDLVVTQTTVPVGKMYVDVCSIFEMFFDPAITEWTKQRAYIREKTVTGDEAKARWASITEDIRPNVIAGADEYYAESLPTLGPALDEASTSRLLHSGQRQAAANRVTEQWYWQLPDVTYPEGLLAVIIGKSHVGFAGPLPYGEHQADGSRRPFLPHVFFPQKLVPGSAFPKTVADDLAHKQAQRNRWESIVEACGMRMGSPIWLKPTGCNVRNLTGEPGQIVDYSPSPAAPQLKPERISGQGIPLSFIQMIKMIDGDFEELGATFDIIKGARPAGVSAGIALQILQERGMSRYGSLFILWENAWAEWARQALEIFRQFATEERLLKIRGRDGEWEVQKFVGADLRGRVDVIPEAGSSMPRSTLVERAETEQLMALRVLNPADPDTRFKVLELYGKTHLLPSMAADSKNAIMEHETFEALAQDPMWQQTLPEDLAAIQGADYPMVVEIMAAKGVKLPRVRGAVDDHAIHSREHGQWLKSERSQKLPEIIQIVAEKMKAYHDTLMIQQMQALQGVSPTPNATAGFLATMPSPGEGGGNPMREGSSPERMQGDMAELTQDIGVA